MVSNEAFEIGRLPRILFGEGRIAEVGAQIAAYGNKALLVTGARSFQATSHWPALQRDLATRGIDWVHQVVAGEPSPALVDQAVKDYQNQSIDVVVGIGGGSVLDAAKAIAGLLPSGHSVLDYLEGVGRNSPYRGPSLPFIAVPTTAGTGSEATKNAVLSTQGGNGFKKSFRHDQLVAQVAIVDPMLLASCLRPLLAADGMDAFTQLLEAYVSSKANPLTDALALSGITAFREGFFAVWENEDEQSVRAGRTQLAYSSLLSGICLAHAGLGSVHGLASPLGAFFPCPHGVVCGTLVAEATDLNIAALEERAPQSPVLLKYVRVGRLLAENSHLPPKIALTTLVKTLRHWTEQFALPRLGVYGVQPGDVDRIVANSRGGSMKTNPLVLTDGELGELVRRRL